LKVFDTVSDPEAMAEARLHIHPKWQCRVLDFGRAELVLDGEGLVLVSVEGGAIISERNTWQPQFGLALPNCCLVVRFKASLCTEISWKV
jgi:uncharacterized heparinase superfamily protein